MKTIALCGILVVSALILGTGCGGETKTIRKETVQTTVPAAPVVVEKRTKTTVETE